ncbi:YggS family pyridoxal phosphate-dependent enzyme [Dyadobacter sediminis]|uniref:Pyridoxal phosphate homeostasis protein n=1 Tax=Dyadobacter sediminis TaxID=1493691 RepID=A0A5R9KKV6_9BACT|nr:YggS family pyridoxal phosphate-dependent enzyme [Dyadobacter sediminis]TLU96848.1 YggS family pyridoxal phosphate-dependent enzyme [Dyadobacter sediminis]GGB85625.1 YggS family pyridoxal phosphate enzyme [Dyadobacter sediminis]
MPSIAENIAQTESRLKPGTRLVAVTKTKPVEMLLEAYNAGSRLFGENKVQEMAAKYEALPKDIEWHMIGHLQTNKVKYMAPFVSLIHSVDSLKLLKEINKEAAKNDRVIPCLLQIFIAREETKFGLSEEEAAEILQSEELQSYKSVIISGLMGMASNTDDETKIRAEFRGLKSLFDSFKQFESDQIKMQELSMGMSGDYPIAVEEGSTLVRVGSAIFGSR